MPSIAAFQLCRAPNAQSRMYELLLLAPDDGYVCDIILYHSTPALHAPNNVGSTFGVGQSCRNGGLNPGLTINQPACNEEVMEP